MQKYSSEVKSVIVTLTESTVCDHEKPELTTITVAVQKTPEKRVPGTEIFSMQNSEI
jgi:hypothetical protein